MRHTLLIFLLTSLTTYGQTKLLGTYVYSNFGGHVILKFSGNNKFEYDASTCIKQWVGQGTYQIKNKRLLLFFAKADSTKNDHYMLTQNKCIDSTYLIVNVVDLQNDPRPFINAGVFDKKQKAFLITDMQGKISINLKNYVFPITIRIHSVGSSPMTINVKDKCCPVITAYFNTDGPEIVDGKKESYKILQMDSTHIVLKPGDTWYLKKID